MENLLIKRNEGVTPAEKYLKKLCERTFLSLWSYPGLYKDDGIKNDGDGKEICDLLVVFENKIIIFSDKDCAYKDTGDAVVDWQRWFKKSIFKSAEQLWGAEKWIRKNPNRIFFWMYATMCPSLKCE